MVYQSNHDVVVPNFRSRDPSNPHQKRSQFCPVEKIEYVSFQQREINEFLGDNSQGRVTLEDLMKTGRLNTSPFIKDDSLLPTFFGGLMLGEGCLTQEESRFCVNPTNAYSNLFSEGINKKVYFCKINNLIGLDKPQFIHKGNTLFFFDIESARESMYRQSTIEDAPEGLEINPITNAVRYQGESITLANIEMRVLSSIDDDNSIGSQTGNKRDKVYLSNLNKSMRELCGMYVSKPRGKGTYCFKSVQNIQ